MGGRFFGQKHSCLTFGENGSTTGSRSVEIGDEVFSFAFGNGSFDLVERGSKLFERSFQFFRVGEEDIVPHLWRRGCDAREVSKAAGRQLGEIARRMRTFERCQHERIGNRVRQVRGERENRVVLRVRRLLSWSVRVVQARAARRSCASEPPICPTPTMLMLRASALRT